MRLQPGRPGAAADYAPLMERIGDARVVLPGEASHGTQEFYAERARITRQLILEKGFDAVASEGDWPDAVIHIDETRALEPLEWPAGVQASRVGPAASPILAAVSSVVR